MPALVRIVHSIAIVPNANVTLLISGLSIYPAGTEVRLQVTRWVLNAASFKFSQILIAAHGQVHKVLDFRAEHGDSMYVLCNMLHLQYNNLPDQIPPALLYRIALLADKYDCASALQQGTLRWFYNIFAANTGFYAANTSISAWRMCEAAYLLDEPAAFARFTSRWVTEGQPIYANPTALNALPQTQLLEVFLQIRLKEAATELRDDIDHLVEQCARIISEEGRHRRNRRPGVVPNLQLGDTPSSTDSTNSTNSSGIVNIVNGTNGTINTNGFTRVNGADSTDRPDDTNKTNGMAVECYVDARGAKQYLGALRDAGIWPVNVWRLSAAVTIGDIADRVANFQLLGYDDSDRCDNCKIIDHEFGTALDEIKTKHASRLWGLCLDCFKAGGSNRGRYECRWHPRIEEN